MANSVVLLKYFCCFALFAHNRTGIDTRFAGVSTCNTCILPRLSSPLSCSPRRLSLHSFLSHLFFHCRLVLSFVLLPLPSPLGCGPRSVTLSTSPLSTCSAASALPSYLACAMHKPGGASTEKWVLLETWDFRYRLANYMRTR